MKTLLLSIGFLVVAASPAARAATDRAGGNKGTNRTAHAAGYQPAAGDKDRIFVADGSAWLSQNGVAFKLSRPVKLNNGGQVWPTGEVDFPGGRRGLLRPGQYITLSGKIGNPIVTPVPHRLAVRRLDGILIHGGHAYLIQGGQSSRLAGPYRLNMGAVVHPNGRVDMPDGTASQLGNGQLLTFSGRIRNPGGNPAGNSPLWSYPRNPNAVTTGESQAVITTDRPNAAPLLGEGMEAR